MLNEWTEQDFDFEKTLERFESSWTVHARPEIKDYLPPVNHQDYLRTLVELARCDLEFAWEAGLQESARDIVDTFPALDKCATSRQEIAFEEYRMRHSHGESISKETFQKQLDMHQGGATMKLSRFLFSVRLITSLIPSTSWATKARLAALQGARFLTDTQLVFQNPGQIMKLGNYVTYEFGGATTASAPKSEGGIFTEMGGNGRSGIYLGHLSADQIQFRSANGFLLEENPVEIFYGMDCRMWQ